MEALIRKKQNLLINSGKAVIFFGLWSIVRTTLLFVMDKGAIISRVGVELTEEELSVVTEDFVFVVCLIALSMELLFRSYVGKRAIREGKGYKQHSFYIVICIIAVVLSVMGDISMFENIIHKDVTEVLSYIIVDVSSCVSLTLIPFSAITLRRLQNKKVR